MRAEVSISTGFILLKKELKNVPWVMQKEFLNQAQYLLLTDVRKVEKIHLKYFLMLA